MRLTGFLLALLLWNHTASQAQNNTRPNVIFIYIDDLGYGDISCNGAVKIKTPHIDQLAKNGLRFTNAHATASTCTPSRYSLLTGRYAFRKKGTGIAPGDASLIIPQDKGTIASMMKGAGYSTAVIGKWHLGLGGPTGPDWNGELKPGPNEIGFDYSYIIPATVDRVPCVFVENHRVVNLDPADPIRVSYKQKIGNEPTGKENPELLKIKTSPGQGHDQTIVNGISRIGYMSGGKAALWKDETIADVITGKAVNYIREHADKPFFLYFATHDIHVPRVPAERFAGKSGMGPRGDVILQMDWTVGEIMRTLKELKIDKRTLIIFSSDNGPVVDDGYMDDAVAKLKGHKPSGEFRGGKYSAFEAGTRVPLILSWPDGIKAGKTSNTLVSQVDFYASLARLTGQKIPAGDAKDSFDMLAQFTGKSFKNRNFLVEQAGPLSIVKDDWKYIVPNKGAKLSVLVNIETGNDEAPQLYNLRKDPGEKNNLAAHYPEKVKELAALLEEIRTTNN